ncbi:MAG: N-acetyl-gamma-glutamyl-phosphate reductase [Bacteroidota bacterium]|nr:N-acetyl-gamma-glutamyl-phosphate reductase [Candidatus Kapabacteria bacterium]MDW8219074.1 N-acetyl-gamma-glutamyl-phosphate reductase [Bacteroidota bacterium]
MNPIRAGIVGSAGYTGGELIRLLLHHNYVELVYIHSTSNAGKPVAHVHTDLLGDTDRLFTDQLSYDIDVLFLCLGHGEAKAFLSAQQIPQHIRIIDLSQDFRYTPSTQWLYGLPELYHEQIQSAQHTQQNIANPGCFATCIQLGLLPLASAQLLPRELHITGITGSTGAGQALSQTVHFSWRSGNIAVYKPFTHQHLYEVQTSLRTLQPDFDDTHHIYFVPMRGNFTRGILTSMYGQCTENAAAVQALYREYYDAHPFVHIADSEPDIKQVVNTNKCLLSVAKHGNMLHIVAVIDNLLKGAAGQAVQNMNLIFGLPEVTGLLLKPLAF